MRCLPAAGDRPAQRAGHTGRVGTGRPSTSSSGELEIGKEHVIISIDAENGFVSINGWIEKTKIYSIDLINQMSEIGINQFIYTDISRDGTLSGPNYKKILELINPKYSILAAGGITNIEHLKKLKDIGVHGSITVSYTHLTLPTKA